MHNNLFVQKYVEEIRCHKCLLRDKCTKEYSNPQIKHLYGQACYKEVMAAAMEGNFENFISVVEMALDNGIELTDYEMDVYHEYTRIKNLVIAELNM